eukprot:190077_1
MTKESFVFSPITQLLFIFIWCFTATVVYAMVHDQVIARICYEYFTKGFHHAMLSEWTDPIRLFFRIKLLKYENEYHPTKVALIWGFFGSCIVGLVIGVVFAAFHLFYPKDMNILNVMIKTKYLYLIAFVFSLIGGYIEWKLFAIGSINVNSYLYEGMDQNKLGKWVICSGANHGLYASAVVGGIMWIFYIIYKDRKDRNTF